ncbi:hypothetical protein [Xanthovirga aplysinae]|uniref:hypothetical protein n=1 Tax=Xanthovirga aplysinae TaxID=2529853 RepID=UPI0012BD4C79|nr:hypothetical protein [Xanthovirga aplysinae]MTI29708.1 hypothetical protein [Xanthovirga aplysinae]
MGFNQQKERRAQGIVLVTLKEIYKGRTKASSMGREELLKKHAGEIKYFKKGNSLKDTTLLVKKGISSIQRVKKAWES